MLLGVVGVVVLAVVATFLNAVMLIAADDALWGRPVAIRGCYARAAGRWRAIAGWAPVGALGVVGAMLLVGMAWSLASYLVLPAVVLDGAGVREARRRARESYRRDRGRFTEGSGAVTAPVLVTLLPSLVMFAAGLTLTGRGLGVLLMVGAALCLGVGVTASASLYGVFRVRLYLESKGAAAPEPAFHVSPVQ
ncbi:MULTISPECIES: hypothetical protein [unclassified Kitasatospora]|uniref:hypothetical protein n=1 Tax=unclassified Kitasatospora TaxID=2633591 RepID=UPI0038219131